MKGFHSNMEALKSKFVGELQDLESLIKFYDLESKLFDSFKESPKTKEENVILELSTCIKSFRISKLQFNYNSIIISLYGSFERFIEDILITYVDRINSLIKTYGKLPDSILKQHFSLSISLLNKVEQPKYNGPLRKEDIIKNLHTCLNTVNDYELNKDAFSQHSANFRLQVIDETFSQVGIKQISTKILKIKSFKEYIASKLGVSEDRKLKVNESFQILNELAELRNFVAHGVSSSIIQNNILLDYLVFFRKYTSSLVEVLNNNLLHFEIEENSIELGEITDVFRDGEIICLNTKNTSINIGDKIIGKNEHNIIKTTIKGIKFNDVDIERIDSNENYEIGINVEDKIKRNYKIYLVK